MIPSTKEVLDQVIPNYITGNIYGCLVESYASENNARMTAMHLRRTMQRRCSGICPYSITVQDRPRLRRRITEVIAGAKGTKKGSDNDE